MVDSENEAIRMALAFVRERLWQLEWEPVVASASEHPDYWTVEYNSRQFVETGDESFRVATEPLVVEKLTGLVGVYHADNLPPWTASWEEVVEAGRLFQRALLRFERRPDADDILRENARRASPYVSEIVLGHPHGWPTRDQLGVELVSVAVQARDVYTRRCSELLHLLPPEVVAPAVDAAIDSAFSESDETERWYQLNVLIDVCAELVLGQQVVRLIEILRTDPSLGELAERAKGVRSDERWGTRMSTWSPLRDLPPSAGAGERAADS